MKQLSLLLLLGSCSAGIDGNERGGVISYGGAEGRSAAAVNAQVEAHCAKYGRKPSVPPNAQPVTLQLKQYQFECVPR